MSIEIKRGTVVSGACNNKKDNKGQDRTIDGQDHTSKRFLPVLFVAQEDRKAFDKACAEFLAGNAAITAGEPVVIVRGDGTAMDPKESVEVTDVHQVDNVTLIPRNDLPTTYAALADLINAGLKSAHVQQINALLNKNYLPKTNAAARATAASGVLPSDFSF